MEKFQQIQADLFIQKDHMNHLEQNNNKFSTIIMQQNINTKNIDTNKHNHDKLLTLINCKNKEYSKKFTTFNYFKFSINLSYIVLHYVQKQIQKR